MKGLFISGSGTNVGKTFIAQKVIKLLSKTRLVNVRKPVESDCKNVDNKLVAKDAELLSQACNTNESIDVVCKFKFEMCASAELASTSTGVDLTLDNLLNACRADEFVVVEGAGGLYSPIATQLLNSDLAQALGLPVVLVIKDGLGAINQALLSISAAKSHNLSIAVLVLNQIQANNLNNAEAISRYTDVPVVVFDENFDDSFLRLIKQG